MTRTQRLVCAAAASTVLQNVRTPLDMVRSPSLPYADVFDLPLSMLFFWVFPNYSEPYKDTYELAVYLLQRCVCANTPADNRGAQVTPFVLGAVGTCRT